MILRMAIERDYQSIDTIIIHCAATPNGSQHTAVDVNYWHGPDREARGLRPFFRHSPAKKYHASKLQHIGYHFVIRTDGITEVGRAIREVGAHAYGHNTNSIGICLIGTDAFTEAQWLTLAACVRSLRRDFPSIKTVIGHHQVDDGKTCPGFSVQDWLASDMCIPRKHLHPQPEDSNGH